MYSAHLYSEGLRNRQHALFPFYTQMEPLKLCLEWAAERKNEWGSTVRVTSYDDHAELETRRCAVLQTALEMGRKRNEFCGLCQLWHSTAMKDMGLELTIALTREGCQYKLSPGKPASTGTTAARKKQ